MIFLFFLERYLYGEFLFSSGSNSLFLLLSSPLFSGKFLENRAFVVVVHAILDHQ